MKRGLFFFFSTFGSIAIAAAANGPVIGVAVTDGLMSVNHSDVTGNANLASGSVVRTESAPGRLQLYKGPKVVVGEHSQVKVFDNHIVLDQGATQIAGAPGYSLEALGIRVAPSGNAQAIVRIDASKVLVAAVNGPVRVSNQAGVPLASLASGRSLSFQPTGQTDLTSTMRGTLTRDNGRFMLPDETSGLKVELTGEGLDREVGRRVEVTGTARSSTDRNTQLVAVASVNRLSGDAASPEPSPAPAPSPAPKPQGQGGMSAGVIIGTLVVIGTVAGLGVYFGTTQPERQLSR